MAAPPQHGGSTLELLLSQLSTATARELPRLKIDAEQMLQGLRQSRQAASSAESRVAKGTYDRWVLDVFRATENVLPIEALLRDFARRFAEVHELKPGRGPWLLVLSGFPPHGGDNWQFNALTHAGLSDQQWSGIRQRLVDAGDNPLLQEIFSGAGRSDDLQLAYLPYVRDRQEQGLFDELLGVRRGAASIGANVWLKVQPLTHDNGRITHAVVVLYSNRGELFDLSSLPAGAQGDQRALDILEPVFRQLSGQLRTLAELIDRAKREVLSQIGSGLLYHEIGGGVRNMRATAKESLRMVDAIEAEFEASALPIEFNALATHVRSLNHFAEQVENTADAFNQLDRQGAITALPLQVLFKRTYALVKVRCGSLHVRLSIEQTDLEVQTDSTMLLHAVLNLVMNALDAIEIADDSSNEEVRISCGLATGHEAQKVGERMVWIEVANTGSRISSDVRHRLFQRGVTSRPGGHGQGLFLVRRIAQYCGGDAQLVEPPPNGFDVAFRILIAQVLNSATQLGMLEGRK